jgi:hypothetical protein
MALEESAQASTMDSSSPSVMYPIENEFDFAVNSFEVERRLMSTGEEFRLDT